MYSEIYLVDDMDMVNLMHQVLLRQLNQEDKVKSFTNPEEALDDLRFNKSNSEPKLVLLDISMPEMGGFEFLEFMVLEEFPLYIDVVIITSSNEGSDWVLAEQYPQFVKGFLQKPLRIDDLKLIVEGNLALC